MSAEDLSDRLDPIQRYAIDGDYDPASFDDDLRDYPSLFDGNGWPLFGSYDPYALVHPITGLSWHLAPRVSTLDEADADYGFWYELAMAFGSEQLKLTRELKRGRARVPLRDPGTDNALYKMTSRQALLGNTSYLRSRVLPRLNELISKRVATPELAVLWGEFRGVVESTPDVVAREVRYYKSGARGAADNREGQLKFYLHWRRYYCEEKKYTIIKANGEFIKLASQIVNDQIGVPEGFNKLWFHHTRKQLRGSTRDNPQTARGLASSLTRALQDSRAKALLASPPDEEPRIPPLELGAYHPIVKKPGVP